MRFPFDNKFAPLTDGFGFIEIDLESALKKYLEWITPQIEKRIKMSEIEKGWNDYNEKLPKVTKFEGSFEELINASLPFFYPQKTILFETKSNNIGYLENIRDTEIRRIGIIANNINALKQSIGVRAWGNSFGKIANGWGGGTFILFEGNDFKRSIELTDQEKWQFDQGGEPLPFEDTEKYKEKFARNRFTPEMLQKYLLHYKIDYFNDDFYMPEGSKAYIIEHIRDPYPDEIPKTLKERRIELKYEPNSYP